MISVGTALLRYCIFLGFNEISNLVNLTEKLAIDLVTTGMRINTYLTLETSIYLPKSPEIFKVLITLFWMTWLQKYMNRYGFFILYIIKKSVCHILLSKPYYYKLELLYFFYNMHFVFTLGHCEIPT